MMETIGPMVDEARRRGPLVRAAHVVGGAAGGALTGGAVALVGLLAGADGLEGTARIVLLAAALVALVYDLATHGRRIGASRQTPMGWRHRFSPALASFLYGVDLGTGFTTRMYFASFLVGLLAAGLSGAPLVGAAIGAGFGAVRAATALTIGRRSSGRPTLIDELAERRSVIEAVNAAALIQFGVVLLVV